MAASCCDIVDLKPAGDREATVWGEEEPEDLATMPVTVETPLSTEKDIKSIWPQRQPSAPAQQALIKDEAAAVCTTARSRSQHRDIAELEQNWNEYKSRV